MSFVIRYADGAYNYGPSGTAVNGFPVSFAEASRYQTRADAEAKCVDLRLPDGSGVEVVELTADQEAASLTPLEVLIDEAKSRNEGLRLLAAVPAIEAAIGRARKQERENCANALELSNSALALMAGEMTAQELRTVKAVLKGCAARIRLGRS